MNNNDWIAAIYAGLTMFVLVVLLFYWVLYLFLKSGDGKHTSKGIEQTKKQAIVRKVMQDREADPDYGFKPKRLDFGPNSYPKRDKIYHTEDTVSDQTVPKTTIDSQDIKATAHSVHPKRQATELDNQADPKVDILVNSDGEPISTKDLNRPSFSEITNDKDANTSSQRINQVSGDEQDDSSSADDKDEPTDWDALFGAAARLVDGK